MSHIYWSGPRQSDIFYTGDLFAASATFYGNNDERNHSYCRQSAIRVNHNIEQKDVSDFILKWQHQVMHEDDECRFMSYNPNCVYGGPREIVEKTICLNDFNLMEKLSDKLSFRKMAGSLVPMVPIDILNGHDIVDYILKNKCSKAYVIQEPKSSGGHGTFLINKDNSERIKDKLSKDIDYLVSEYIEENIPVNLHAVIYTTDIITLPASVQIVKVSDDRILYRGADFQAFSSINEKDVQTFHEKAMIVLKLLQQNGYRGVVGIDGILTKKGVFIVEVNNRFQGSSVVINKMLWEEKLPSLQQMTIDAFDERESARIKDHKEWNNTNYSLYIYINELDGIHAQINYEKFLKNPEYELLAEGYDPKQKAEKQACLYEVIFKRNITSQRFGEYGLWTHSNIVEPTVDWYSKITNYDLTSLKISLLNQGIVIDSSARNYLEQIGGWREGVYYSIDLFIDGTYMNAPLYTKFVEFSPFLLCYDEINKLFLRYYNRKLLHVDCDMNMTSLFGNTNSGVPLKQILFVATDRLRIQNHCYCTFARQNKACKFCEAVGINNHFYENDIIDAIDIFFSSEDSRAVRHILIGGLSNEYGEEIDVILAICRRIRKYSDMPIYLMCLPPRREDIIRYINAGVTEFGFNIEVFNREIASAIMPAKGKILLEKYFEALDECVSFLGVGSHVMSAFIVGLEPYSSIISGIEMLCKHGVTPILSIFRPIYGTEMSEVIPPSNEWLYKLVVEAETIAQKYSLSLGPQCPACRNNTLTIVKRNEVKLLEKSGWRR